MTESIDVGEAVGFLACAEIEILGLLPYASNATLLTRIKDGEREALAVYKPRRGERPLWDFPDGTLCLRETAAWVISQELGWGLVPPTVLREGPAGFGALQWFIDEDVEADVRKLPQSHPEELQRLVLFDAVANNADRKAGHLIIDTGGRLWGIDHGICFAVEPKLRTVIWVFEGEPIPDALLADLETLRRTIGTGLLSKLLDREEVDALCERVSTVLQARTFPNPDPGGRHVPWPPW